MPQPSLHRITMDSEWALVDLYEFPHTYTQIYAFLYSLAQHGRLSSDAIDEIYQRHPWRGGYSAFNFYTDLYYAMEEDHRPMVHSIRYVSPGFIEIESSKELGKVMHFEGLEQLQTRTQDWLGTLKIMLSFYRRIRRLVEFQLTRKIKYDGDDNQIEDKST